jgi:transglutaminase-like putative cysteine protease
MPTYAIRYTNRFLYPQPVFDSYNVLRACPITDVRQTLRDYAVQVDPTTRVHSHADYFGTRVDVFGVRQAHARLEVIAESRVEVAEGAPAPLSPARDFAERNAEYLLPGRHTGFADGLRAAAADLAGGGTDERAARAICEWVGSSLRYEPGHTWVGIDVNEVFTRRRGVCQDFAHLAIAMCRSVGIPARYVSGYLFAPPAEASESEVAEGETHAWLEVGLGGEPWLGLDPTHRADAGAGHVKIGHGRDYDDVCPLRGVYKGPFQHELDVSVRIERLGGAVLEPARLIARR